MTLEQYARAYWELTRAAQHALYCVLNLDDDLRRSMSDAVSYSRTSIAADRLRDVAVARFVDAGWRKSDAFAFFDRLCDALDPEPLLKELSA